jgi:hypothetical protein
MAKQVKVITGAASAAMYQQQIATPVYDNYGNFMYYDYSYPWVAQQTVTIYTCPSGRVAKVELQYLNWNLPNSGAQLILGSSNHSGANVAYGQYSQNYWTGSSYGGLNQNFHYPQHLQPGSNGQFPRIIYLNAGESIRFTSPSQGNSGTSSLNYSLMVVEEY